MVKALRERLGKTAVLVDETIAHSRAVQQHLGLDEPGQDDYVPGGRGQGIALALGVKLAEPRRSVVLTIRDGSLIYNAIVPPLAAARDLEMPLLMLVIDSKQCLSIKFNHLRADPRRVEH